MAIIIIIHYRNANQINELPFHTINMVAIISQSRVCIGKTEEETGTSSTNDNKIGHGKQYDGFSKKLKTRVTMIDKILVNT